MALAVNLQDLLPPEAIARLAEPCQTCDGDRFVGDGPWCLRSPCPNCADRTIYLNVGMMECAGCTTTTEPHEAWGESGAPAPPEWVKLAEACDGSEACSATRHIHGCWRSRMQDEGNESTFHEGRKVHTISVPCPRCQGDPEWCLGCVRCNPSGRSATSGTVEYRAVVTELLPVVDRLRAEKDGGYVIVKPNHVRLYYVTGNGRYRYITVAGEPPKPGDWIAVIEVLT